MAIGIDVYAYTKTLFVIGNKSVSFTFYVAF